MPRSRNEEILRRVALPFVLACLIGASTAVGCGGSGKPRDDVLEDTAFSQMLVELSSTEKEASLLEDALTGFLKSPSEPSARSSLATVLAHTELPASVWRMPMIRWSLVDGTTALVASDFFTACELARHEVSALRAALGVPIDPGLTLAVELDERCRITARPGWCCPSPRGHTYVSCLRPTNSTAHAWSVC